MHIIYDNNNNFSIVVRVKFDLSYLNKFHILTFGIKRLN